MKIFYVPRGAREAFEIEISYFRLLILQGDCRMTCALLTSGATYTYGDRSRQGTRGWTSGDRGRKALIYYRA